MCGPLWLDGLQCCLLLKLNHPARYCYLCCAATYYWLQRTVVPKVQKREKKKKQKAKMSVGESFAFLAGSRYVCWVKSILGWKGSIQVR